jgi:immune inhibitor A
MTGLAAAAFLVWPAAVRAVPANPAGAEVRQADGSVVRIFLKGDEFSKRNEDAGGYTVLKTSPSSDWFYAEKNADGSLKAGPLRVGAGDPDKLGVGRHLRDTSAVRRAAAAAGLSRAPAAKAPILTGTMKNLVILARFSDQTTTYSRAEFDSLFNTAGYTVDGATGSVKDYYLQVSYNNLVVQSTVTEWVVLPQPFAYYGINDLAGQDTRPKQMVSDAIAALAATGFDFSAADGNGDGAVDGLTIIHSGLGEEFSTNNPDYIWSHQWSLDAPVTKNGVTMQMYHTEAEVRGWDAVTSSTGIARIGVICHETGHFLGLPDLYDYGGDSAGAGTFCLMAQGSWNGSLGSKPAHLSAWCKKELGWATATQLSAPGAYALGQIETNSSALYLFRGGAFPAAEYFLAENRQGYGFDGGLPGPLRGMLIWHVDEAAADNNNQAHYKVGLKQADGLQDLELNTNSGTDADYFRTGTNTSFGDATTPNSKSFSSLNLDLRLWNISGSSNTMTFSLANTAPPSISVLAYPRPWKPGSGASHDAAGITFSSLPDSATIRIYTLLGELVKELKVTAADLNRKVWDGRNTAGKAAASGVYFARIKADTNSADQVLKIAIER